MVKESLNVYRVSSIKDFLMFESQLVKLFYE